MAKCSLGFEGCENIYMAEFMRPWQEGHDHHAEGTALIREERETWRRRFHRRGHEMTKLRADLQAAQTQNLMHESNIKGLMEMITRGNDERAENAVLKRRLAIHQRTGEIMEWRDDYSEEGWLAADERARQELAEEAP
ncbi:MAG: hypothetical protein V3V32_04600 [Dehalococcoidia bacterium]